MTYLSVVEQPKRCISDDEDYIALYENEGSYIYYVRNYAAQTEFLLLSMDLVMSLDDKFRTVAGVYFTPHFSVLKHFESEVTQHVLTSALLPHFHYLFNCSVSKFIMTL